jgi:hypothetical protein
MLKSRFIILFILFLSLSSAAQINVGCKLGYIYQRSSYLEGGVLIYKRSAALETYHLDMYGMNIGSDLRIGGSKFIAGPKISFEAHYFTFGARLGVTFFTDFKQVAPAISPEIGIGFLGYFYLMAGYNWTLSNKEFWNTTGLKISLGVNLSGRKDH